MARFDKMNYFRKAPKKECGLLALKLSKELNLPVSKIETALRSLGVSLQGECSDDEYDLYKDLVCSKYELLNPYIIDNQELAKNLDEQIRGFDEIYIDTAPIIHEDWFLYFVANVIPVLRRRRKKLVILEKTFEELHGLKNNDLKTKEVRLRATIRPTLIKSLAKKGLAKIMDTGSIGIADDHLVKLFRRRGKSKDILLITQDRELSERIVLLQEELNKNIEIPHYSFFERLFHRHFIDEDIHKKVIACKLLEGGKLLRLYICPVCKDSYYDKILDCEGFVICSSCYYDLKELDEVKQIKLDKNAELEKQAELERKAELNRILEEKEYLKNKTTVAKKIKKRKMQIRVSLIIVILVILLIVFLN
jgi:uncharacterized Zn finger protein (UPF0148 family)/rRNA-processing protein FCF1